VYDRSGWSGWFALSGRTEEGSGGGKVGGRMMGRGMLLCGVSASMRNISLLLRTDG
jgi:hypothetical protein